MKKKILLLSTLYTSPDVKVHNNTNVVHYFAREWVKLGYEVEVIYNYPIYLRIFHWIAALAEKLIASKFSTSVTTAYIKQNSTYQLDGVKVTRIPLFKPFPHYKVPRSVMNKHIEKIADICTHNSFVPDFIIAHNFYPHIEMVNKLRRNYYSRAKTCVVVHKQNLKMLEYLGSDYKKQIQEVDIWGYRSLPLKRSFESYVGLNPKYFMCYSGVSSSFLSCDSLCCIKQPIANFVYVGSFIKRKFPEKIITAVKLTKLEDFHITYIGDGVGRKDIKNLTRRYSLEDRVHLFGFVPREQVPLILSKYQCFIMISSDETFGLVYLEAMSLGCITVASKNEGMEGIIENGKNGFLCEAGNEKELAAIINRINTLSDEELMIISNNARQTALKLTDESVAKHYINILEELCDEKTN